MDQTGLDVAASVFERVRATTAPLKERVPTRRNVAGRHDDGGRCGPAPLAEVIRSATTQAERGRHVSLGSICDVTIAAPAVADLTFLLTELLDNATAASPPEVPVEVSARLLGSLHADCLIGIVDRGLGMSPEHRVEANRRLVAPDRLDVAPMPKLGLFAVGRLARRHRIGVRLYSTPISGVTVEVRLPVEVWMSGRQPR